MRTFKKLTEIVAYIRSEEEETSAYRWNNDGGDWDLEDIECNAVMYDEQYSEYSIDVVSYDIYGDGEKIFWRIE